jgi:pyruvate/2-oxoglutarate dehydrogenase complex dihydrolipoamide acyltransferase (E2) component
VDKLMALRKQINEALAAAGGAKLSVNDFIVKASALVRLVLAVMPHGSSTFL